MSYVVAIFGASGSGKSSLMQLLADAGSQYSIHIKYTTRALRTYDGIEIRAVLVSMNHNTTMYTAHMGTGTALKKTN